VVVQTYIVDAFTRDGAGGNPAGVVLDAEQYSEQEMQHIANVLGFSETAFVSEIESHTHNVRFFTPTAEVRLCGHATIASYALLSLKNKIQPGSFTMITKAGPQRISLDDGLVSMTQNLPEFGSTLQPNDVAPCLGLQPQDLKNIQGLPIQIASTGLHKIFVPIRSLDRLMAIQPNFAKIEAFSRTNGTIGMYCYSLESLDNATAHCRNFAPVVGIQEDSATGTSAAALSCVLHRFGVLPKQPTLKLTYEQGYSINQPAELIVLLETSAQQITNIQVAGRAILRQSRTIEI